MKLALVGGGSSYAPIFAVDALTRAAAVTVEDLFVYDIDISRAHRVAEFLTHALPEVGRRKTTVRVCSMDEAAGADLSVLMFRVGGLGSRLLDAETADSHGLLAQETQGWSGLASGLRNAVEAAHYCELVAEASGTGRVIVVTNPVGIVTGAAQRILGSRAFGVCEMPARMVDAACRIARVDVETTQPRVVGLNHLSYLVQLESDSGHNLLPQIMTSDEFALEFRAAHSKGMPFTSGMVEVARLIGVMPNPYTQYFYFSDAFLPAVGEASIGVSRANECIVLDRATHQSLRERSFEQVHSLHALRGGAPLGDVLGDFMNVLHGSPIPITLCVQNDGALPFLRDKAVIETTVQGVSLAPTPFPLGTIPLPVRGLLSEVAVYEEILVEAAAHRSRDLTVVAALSHPLIRGRANAASLVDSLIESDPHLTGFR